MTPESPLPAPAVSIGAATDADWPALWPLLQEVFRRGDSYTHDESTTEAEARAFWMGRGLRTFVAERDGALVGTYMLRANQPGRGAHVANAGFMVRAGEGGRGVGHAMGAHALEVARAAGFAAMQFNFVVSTNVRAVALWQRLGFRIVGTIPGAYAHRDRGRVDVHVMHRDL